MTIPVAPSEENTAPRRPAPRAIAGLVLIALAVTLYAFTLDNGLQPYELHGGDLITHQYAQVQARPSNAPGYPLYTMGGWLWFHAIRAGYAAAGAAHPNPIPILSSYSTLWALIALWLLYQLICEITGSTRSPDGNWQAAFLLSSFFAVTYFFWYYATTTEQYSSAVAQTLGIVYLYIRWEQQPDNMRRLFLLAFLCGLSLAHMLTVALIVPPIVAAVLWRNPKLLRDVRAVLGSILAAALPLISYAYVYIRGAQRPEWRGAGEWDTTLSWFLTFVSTAQGREELLWGFEPGRSFFGNGFPQLIVDELGWILLIAGIAGIAALKRPLSHILYSTLGLYIVFAWAYRYGNWFQVILPAYPLILVGAGAAIERIQNSAVKGGPQARSNIPGNRLWRSARQNAPLIVLIALIAWRVDASLPTTGSRNRPQDTALDRAALLIDQPLPQGSALFASVDDALALQYLTQIWSLRPDLRVLSSRKADQELARNPVFTTWDAAPTLLDELTTAPPQAVEAFSPDWLILVPASATADADRGTLATTEPAEYLDYPLRDGVTLAGYRVAPSPRGEPAVASARATTDLTLYWRLEEAQWPEDLSISVRPTRDGDFVFDNGGALLQIDRSQPAGGLTRPAVTGGAPIVSDPYRLPVLPAPEPLPDGAAVIVYAPSADGFTDIARIDIALDSQ